MNWYKIYGLLSASLLNFHEKCIEKGKETGFEIFELMLLNDISFKNNNWANKLKEDFGVRSIDPIHLFLSISDENITLELRKIRIDIIFKSIGEEHTAARLISDGFPTFNPISLLSSRNGNEQREIWNFYAKVVKEGRNGIYAKDFNKYKEWNGVSFQGFTFFLFCILSKSFLPITKEVIVFLKFTEVNFENLKNYKNYSTLLTKINKYNFKRVNNYGTKGIYREIYNVANQTIKKGKLNIKITTYLTRLLNDVKMYNFGVEDSNNGFSEIGNNDNNLNFISENDQNDLNSISEISKLAFKLIAIKALDRCSDKLLKNIQKEKYYYFENCVKLEENDIVYYPELNHNIYSINSETKSSLKINVTAVVGKNGSGKSSLIELVYGIINNISYSRRLSLKIKKLKLIKNLAAELIYINSGYLYKLVINDDKINIAGYRIDGRLFKPLFSLRPFKKIDFNIYFYTIAINYSHYGLNSVFLGEWIDGLFHKNDNYQTPIVLNPMRKAGNFDINKENILVNSRLISNLLAPVSTEKKTNIRQLTESQNAISIDFKLNFEKNEKVFDRLDIFGKEETILFNQLKFNKTKIYELIKIIFNFSIDFKDNEFETTIEVKKYIIRKLIKISITYPIYNTYFDSINLKFHSEENLTKYLLLLNDDDSHITYKLKQAINYWKHPDLWSRKSAFTVDLEKDSIKLDNYLSTVTQGKHIHFIPPPIFYPKINLSVPFSKESSALLPFCDLSSGEKQLIYSVNSILYHLKNINSINNNTLIQYKNINIILDEVELYYHPELQQSFVNYLISMIKRMELEFIESINICLITHSPFILSDVMSTNVLKLDNGFSKDNDINEQTFGANINDILAKDFFLTKGFMGSFVKSKINSLITFIESGKRENEEWNVEIAKEFIELIGEPIIKKDLRELFISTFYTNEIIDDQYIDDEIERLQKIKASKNKR